MTQYEPPGGLPWGLFALCGGSLLLNTVLLTRWMMQPVPAGLECTPGPTSAAAATVVVAPSPVVPVQPVDNEPNAVDPVEAVPVEAPPVARPGVKTAALTVHHSLARTFSDGVPKGGDELAAKVARLFVWDLDLRRDLQQGDTVKVAWTGAADQVDIQAARYHSKKRGILEAYRFQPDGDAYASWWTADGTEVARRLKDSPIEGYEQITSLLKDRPRHRGMDFKTPVGTPVTSRAGTVVRADWNTRNNGNCVEVRYQDGTLARFLHLSRTDVQAGERVRAGQVVGLSGNTGHSTAPHLHYELARNEKVVDPVDYHGVTRRTLASDQRPGFDRAVERFRADLGVRDGR